MLTTGASRTWYLVKGPNKLVVPVADQEPEGSPLVLKSSCQVTRSRGDPGPMGWAVTLPRNTLWCCTSMKNST